MVASAVENLLQELAQAMGMEELMLDANNTCLLRFQSGVEVYIEPYEKGDYLLLSCDLGVVTHGRYREDVFREALKANGMPFPRYGIFGYSEATDQLILFKLMSLTELNGEKIASYLDRFTEKAAAWKQALESGVVPLAETSTTSGPATPPGGGMFGMRP